MKFSYNPIGSSNVGSMPGRKVESAWYQLAARLMDGWRWRSKADGDFGDPSLFKKFIYNVHHNVARRPQDLHRTQSEYLMTNYLSKVITNRYF